MNFTSLNLTSSELARVQDTSIVGILIFESEFEMSNFNITAPDGNIGTQTTSFLDFQYLQNWSALIFNMSYSMVGTFIRSWDPLILTVDNIYVDVDKCN